MSAIDPQFSIQHTLTPEQHLQHRILRAQCDPLNRIIRIGALCLLPIFLPLGLLLKEDRVIWRLILFLPLLPYFISKPRLNASFYRMLEKEHYELLPVTYLFGEESICIHFANRWAADITLPYDCVYKLTETNDVFHLFNTKDAVIVLPKSSFSVDSMNNFRAFLKTKTNQEFTKIKQS